MIGFSFGCFGGSGDQKSRPNGINPKIVIDSNDNARVFWLQDDDNDIFGYSDHIHLTEIKEKGTERRRQSYLLEHCSNGDIVVSIDASNNIYILQVNDYLTKMDPSGNFSFKNKNLSRSLNGFFNMICDGDNNIHNFWLENKNDGKGGFYVDLFYRKIDDVGNEIISQKQITLNNDIDYHKPICKIDYYNDIHIIFERDSISWYMKIDENGTILTREIPLSDVVSLPKLPIITDRKGSLLYIDDKGIIDTHNNIHIISTATDRLFYNKNEYLQYTKLNCTGAKLIENKTIAIHEKNKDYDHGPAIFDPKIAIDSEDNIHITWYINDGGNHFSVWYEKIDPNGTVLIPAMKIAPEDEKGKDSTPGFELIPLIMIVVVAAAVMRRRR